MSKFVGIVEDGEEFTNVEYNDMFVSIDKSGLSPRNSLAEVIKALEKPDPIIMTRRSGVIKVTRKASVKTK